MTHEENTETTPFPYWQGRTVVIATKHQKESIIAPLVEQALGVTVVVPPDFDSDQFGTFTGEVKRLPDQRDAAREKALTALAHTGETLAIASEGSFAPDPHLPFLTRATEIVMLVDTLHNLEIMGVHISHAVQPKRQIVDGVEEALAVAVAWSFPEQGVIVRVGHGTKETLYKELVTTRELTDSLTKIYRNQDGVVSLETDLRAHRCPPRHALIRAATEDLIARATTRCPACTTPGFGVTETVPGLPCGHCGRPTDLHKTLVYRCTHCQHTLHTPATELAADPGACSYCNP